MKRQLEPIRQERLKHALLLRDALIEAKLAGVIRSGTVLFRLSIVFLGLEPVGRS
jgi:hypothetical protein